MAEHSIVTGYRGVPVLMEIIHEVLKLIKRSPSPWASLMVLIENKDGAPRVCVDTGD